MKSCVWPWAVLFACTASAACTRIERREPLAPPQPWSYGYTLLEDPAAISSQVSNCLYRRMDPACMDTLIGIVRFTATPDELLGERLLKGYFDKANRRIVYREEASGFVQEEVVVHEVMHWVYDTNRTPDIFLFTQDLARFLEEFADHPTVRRMNDIWRVALESTGESYRSRYFTEYYAYIGGSLAKHGFREAVAGEAGMPQVMPEYMWRHFRGVLSPSLRRWRLSADDEVDLAFGGVDIADISSSTVRLADIPLPEFEALREFGGVVQLAPGESDGVSAFVVDRFGRSIAPFTSACGRTFVPARMPPLSFELRVRLSSQQVAFWDSLSEEGLSERRFVLRGEDGSTLYDFPSRGITRVMPAEAGKGTTWLCLRLGGDAYGRVRRLFSAFYESGISIDLVKEADTRCEAR